MYKVSPYYIKADAAALLDISMAFFSRPKVFVLGLCVARVIHTLSLSTLFMDVGLFTDGLTLQLKRARNNWNNYIQGVPNSLKDRLLQVTEIIVHK